MNQPPTGGRRLLPAPPPLTQALTGEDGIDGAAAALRDGGNEGVREHLVL
jgi:hypothetical protein